MTHNAIAAAFLNFNDLLPQNIPFILKMQIIGAECGSY
jgi:hypothetical protein